jgi:hypothetical protein
MKTIKYSFNYNEHLEIDEEIKVDVIALLEPAQKMDLENPPIPESLEISTMYYRGEDIGYSNNAFIQCFQSSLETEAEGYFWDNYNDIMIKNGLKEDF